MDRALRAAFFPNSQPGAATGAQPRQPSTAVNAAPSQRKRKRTLYSKWQQLELESVFDVIPYPDISIRDTLAKIIRLPESKVQVWFQNRRARKNKSGKFNSFLYRRGPSFRDHHRNWSSPVPAQGYSQRDPLIPIPLPPNQSVTHGYPNHHVSPMQQPAYSSYVTPSEVHQMSPPVPEHFSDEPYVPPYGEHNLQWQNVTSNSEYSFDALMRDTQMEPCTNPSQESYWEMFPQAMNENGSQTSLGYISDVIYNAAILTNVEDI